MSDQKNPKDSDNFLKDLYEDENLEVKEAESIIEIKPANGNNHIKISNKKIFAGEKSVIFNTCGGKDG
jgi:hypothetical protein